MTKKLPTNAISCSCGAWWTGLRRSHCPAAGCHLTFNSDSAAEKHRRGTPGIDRRCITPAEAGLVPVERPWGTCWQTPGSDQPWFKNATEEAAA